MPNKTEFNADFSELKSFAERIERTGKKRVREMMHSAEEDVLDTYVSEVKALTPVRTSRLRDGWKKSREKLKGRKNQRYISAVSNSVPYAGAVENGRFNRETKRFDGHGRHMTRAADRKVGAKIDSIAAQSVRKFEDDLSDS